MDAQRYPLDCDRLEPGSIVTAAECEEILGVKRHLKVYGIKLLELSQEIARRLGERFGRTMVVVQRREGLAVLTEAERVEHVRRGMAAARRKRRRSLVVAAETDSAALSDEERKRLERFIVTESMRMQAEAAVRPQLPQELSATRKTPGPPV